MHQGHDLWSAEKWELFAKNRSYKERKHRPSGSVPPAQQSSPRAETSSGFRARGLLPLPLPAL